MSEQINENCGVGFVYNIQDAIHGVRGGLKHRGKDAEGYGTPCNNGINAVRSYSDLMDAQALITLLKYESGRPILLHTRYKTRGSSNAEDLLRAAHPHTIGGNNLYNGNHLITTNAREAMVHNGTVTFDFSEYGFDAQTGCDTEYLLQMHSAFGPKRVMETIPASYSVVTMRAGDDFVTAYRDRFGRRPLWLGTDREGRHIVMSEDRSIEEIGGNPIREVRPGELLRIYPNQFESEQVVEPQTRLCFFEVNYLVKRLSHVWDILRDSGINVARMRYELGLELFKEHPPLDGVDFVTHIPKSPLDAARAYAEASGVPRKELYYKLTEYDRAFMHPDMKGRVSAINDNLFVDPEMNPMADGRDFVSIDDSIIRLTNGPVARIKAEERGFRMRQMLCYTPMVGGSEDGVDLGCEHGIDMPPDDNFVTRRVGRYPERIAKELGVEYVGFLSLEGLVNVFERHGIGRKNLCLECVTSRN